MSPRHILASLVEAGGVESQPIENQEDTHPRQDVSSSGLNPSQPGQAQDVTNDPNVELRTLHATNPDSVRLSKSTI